MRWHVCLSTYTNNSSSSSSTGSADSSCCRQTRLGREKELGRRQQESFAVSQSRRRRWHMAIFHYPRLTRLTLRLRQPLGLRLRLQTAGTGSGSGFVSVYTYFFFVAFEACLETRQTVLDAAPRRYLASAIKIERHKVSSRWAGRLCVCVCVCVG